MLSVGVRTLRAEPEALDALVAGSHAFDAGNAEAALPELARAAASPSEVRDLAFLLRAEALLSLGRPAEALADARRVATAVIDSCRGADAEWLAARATAALGRHAEAASAFAAFRKLHPRDDRAATALVLIAEELEKARSSQAAAAWKRAALEEPAEAPADALDRAHRLARAAKVPLSRPKGSELLARARALAKANLVARAGLAHAEAAAALRDGKGADEALLGMAQAAWLMRENARCEASALELEQRFPRSELLGEARLLRLRVAWRLGDHDAVDRLAGEALADPRLWGDSKRADMLRIRAGSLADRGCLDEAVRDFEDLLRDHPSSPLADDALWRAAWSRLDQARPAEARELFARLSVRAGDEGLGPGAAFWEGVAADRAGDAAGAVSSWTRVASRAPWTHYGAEARALLAPRVGAAELSAVDAAAESAGIAAELPAAPALKATAHGRRYLLLRDAGLARHALAELDAHRKRVRDSASLLVEVARARVAAGRAASAQIPLRAVLGKALDEPSRRTPRELWALVYPAPHADTLLREASRQGVDPAFCAALVRAESWWDPTVLSSADARGLMQLIPATGARLAEEEGLPNFRPELLFDPEVNIRLGTRYVADLARQFRGDWAAIAAAYNAGEDKAAEWWAAYARDGIELEAERIDRIPFRETRPYVRRVLEAASWYRWLDFGMSDEAKGADSSSAR